MSFSSDVKEELSRFTSGEPHCMMAELYAIIRFCGVEEDPDRGWRIRLDTENVSIARRFFILLKENFHVTPAVSAARHDYLKKNRVYTISVDDHKVCLHMLRTLHIIDDLGRIDRECFVRHNPVLSRTCCRRAFIRGAFVSSGSITDPEKNYHFEIVCSHREEAEQVQEVLASFGLEARIIERKKYQVVYLKEGTMIADVLNIMGAHQALMRFENIRILKDVRNSVNRRVNCETANIGKTVSAARKQIEDIEYIRDHMGLHRLPDNLRAIAQARLSHPDAALKELGSMLEKPVGKSGVNHRLRKRTEIANDLRDKNEFK